MTVNDPQWRAPAEPPTPVTPVPFGKPWSIWFWGGLLSTAGLALAVQPMTVLRLLDSPVDVSALPWVRFCGLLLLAYAMGYHVAGWTGQRTFMRASVVLRVLSLVIIGGFVLLNWLPKAWLAVGVGDVIGAIWTTLELRWRPKPKSA
ncbi:MULTISPECIES: hypothetical protein [unclassified Caulobacter]|jgi:hypothetical protein|uniref:hypothetical protein n=1 Tax=unclassified Caulobacter TaxID=2648921 RepID=UPI000783A7FB|nr:MULTISPECIES: hypothetical protein [unclassified Caulobacter]AZS20298.1 hypothetical protein CSW63_06360 [Caulobacter sp. FWC26]